MEGIKLCPRDLRKTYFTAHFKYMEEKCGY
jgi:hypothetical protein